MIKTGYVSIFFKRMNKEVGVNKNKKKRVKRGVRGSSLEI